MKNNTIIESKTRKSKDGKYIIQITSFIDIKPSSYYKKMLETESVENTSDEEEELISRALNKKQRKIYVAQYHKYLEQQRKLDRILLEFEEKKTSATKEDIKQNATDLNRVF